DQEIIGVRQSAVIIGDNTDDQFVDQPIELASGAKLKLVDIIEGDILPVIDAHYVVSDQVYQQLSEPSKTEKYTVWNVIEGKENRVVAAGEQLTAELNVSPYYNFQAMDYMIYTINQSYAPILFIGLFIGIVFLDRKS